MAYRLLPVSRPAERGLPDDPGLRGAARRLARDDGVLRRDAARAAVLDDRGPRQHDARPPRRARRRSRCSSTSRRNLDGAALDVQSAISAARRQLPPNMPSPPTYGKVNPADQPVLYLTLTSKMLPLSQLDEYGEVMMAQRISTVSGVAQVQVFGPQKYAVRVQLDPRAARLPRHRHRRGRRRRSATPTSTCRPGSSTGPSTSFTVQANGQLFDAAALPARHRRVPQRLAGALSDVGTSSTASRTTRPRPGTTTSARSRSRSSSSPARTRSRSRGGAQAPADLPEAAARRRRRSTSCTTARRRSATRSTT